LQLVLPAGHISTALHIKKAIVRPLFKKSTMDPEDPSSYRQISNFSFLSKVIEKAVESTPCLKKRPTFGLL